MAINPKELASLFNRRGPVDDQTPHGHAQSIIDDLFVLNRINGQPAGAVVDEEGKRRFVHGEEVRQLETGPQPVTGTIFDSKKRPQLNPSSTPLKPEVPDLTGYASKAAVKRFKKNGGSIPESGIGCRSLRNAHRRARAEAEAERLKQAGELRGGKQNKRK